MTIKERAEMRIALCYTNRRFDNMLSDEKIKGYKDNNILLSHRIWKKANQILQLKQEGFDELEKQSLCFNMRKRVKL